MKDFLNLIRDTTKDNNPVGSWQNAKNIVKTIKQKSVTNEKGFDVSFLVPGDIIGEIVTPSEVVFLHKNNDGVDEIGKVNLDDDSPTYNVILRTNLLNFNYNCPIEGIFIYNFKQELLIAWCDGVYDNSNPPRALNTDTLPFEVDVNGNLVNDEDFGLINMTSNRLEGNIDYNYTSNGDFGGYAIYLTYSYVFEDDSNVGYFPINNLLKVGKEIEPIQKLGFQIQFSDLSASFTKLRLGLIVVSNEGSRAGYEGEILDYSDGTLTVDVTSLDNFNPIDPSEIILQSAIFKKVNTMTKQNKEVNLGNVVTSNPNDEIKFQKYANLLNLIPYEYKDPRIGDINYDQEACFMPDEVYAFYIQLQLLDGSYTNAFHIPGRIAEEGETNPLTASQINVFGLDWAEDIEGIKQFHIFNKGNVAGVIVDNIAGQYELAEDESTNKFGYWENTETYPDNDNYNSEVDYEGNTLINGEDLRNNPIRYHRFPSLRSMRENTRRSSSDNPDILGPVQGMFPNNSGTPRKLGVKLTNFIDVVPEEILNQIQNYRILHVKRSANNSYVAGNWMGLRRRDADDERIYGGGLGTPPAPDGQEGYDLGYYID